MMNINAFATSEQKLSRLIDEAAINAAAHLTRLEFLSQHGVRKLSSFSGVERDFLVSVMYSLNEQLAVLNTTGSRNTINAIFFGQLDMRDWYDEAMADLHNELSTSSVMQPINDRFKAHLERLTPTPTPPANAEAMAQAFKDDDVEGASDEEQVSEPGLAAAAGYENASNVTEAAGTHSQASE